MAFKVGIAGLRSSPTAAASPKDRRHQSQRLRSSLACSWWKHKWTTNLLGFVVIYSLLFLDLSAWDIENETSNWWSFSETDWSLPALSSMMMISTPNTISRYELDSAQSQTVVASILERLSSSSMASMASNEQRLRQMINTLEQASWKFYMYNETRMTLLQQQQNGTMIVLPRIWNRYHDEIEYDTQVLQAFADATHLRTHDPTRADIYVIPIPIGQCISHANLDESDALQALLDHPVYKSVQGNRHLLISTAFVTFRSDTKSVVGRLAGFYPYLKHVTVASSQDAAMNQHACLAFASQFLDRYEYFRGDNCMRLASSPVQRYASIGLADIDNVPLLQPSLERFQQESRHVLFYRTRTEESFFNSTLYRKLPLQFAGYFPTSILGYDTKTSKQWLKEFTHSQFCLVIRGDSPNSHALMRSIRVGCIPVIISDTYAIYNPPLPSLLELDDFAFLIPEQAFLANPLRELQALTLLASSSNYTALIQSKLQGLQIAQRLLFPDHPQSLLVEALIHQVLATNKVDYLQQRHQQVNSLLLRNHVPID